MKNKNVLWLFGLPSAGKSTLAEKAVTFFKDTKGSKVVHLDGDRLRAGVCKDLGYTLDERAVNIERAAEIAKILTEQDNLVVVSMITPLKAHRDIVREVLGEDVQFVWVHASLIECMSRDVKGLYAKAAEGKVDYMTGKTSSFETPAAEEDNLVVVHTTGYTPEESFDTVVELLELSIPYKI